MWEREARYCPLCAAELVQGEIAGRIRKRCGSCRFVLFRNPAAAGLGVVLDTRARVLLVKRGIEPFRDHWALPAGYQEADETPEQAVVREVGEETGIEVQTIGLLDLSFYPDDPRKPANIAAFLCRPTGGALAAGGEEKDVGWFALDALPEPIGFDNYRRILGRLLEARRYPDSPWKIVQELLRTDGGEGGP